MSSAAISNRRLFVGNLSESVDEYTLIKFLSKHGKISKFDYLFHKSGPKQGKPRGYAFVEYGTSEEALKTMIELDGKLLLGRKVAIKRANEAPPEHSASSSSGAWRGTGQKHTTLSVLKGHGKPESAESKIKALEAKLQALEAQKAASETSRNASASISDAEGTPEPDSSSNSTAAASEAGPSTQPIASTSTLPLPPSSLPSKPPSSLPSKPDQDTISKGEKAQRSHKAELEQKQEQRFDQRHRGGPNRDRNKKPVEVPKSTLASLGASMGK